MKLTQQFEEFHLSITSSKNSSLFLLMRFFAFHTWEDWSFIILWKLYCQCYVPKIWGRSFAKRYVTNLLAGIIFDIYDQHTQIITESDVKLSKWHITIEKLYRKPTET